MDANVAKDMIRAIRAERDKKKRELRATEDPDMGDLWPFMGEPFINELCLALLVAIRGHFERELVLIAARVTSDGQELSYKHYHQRVEEEREELKGRNGWKKLRIKLQLDSIPEWDSSMETLHFLANSYKHNPEGKPDKALVSHLKLPSNATYGPLSESQAFKNGLAAYLGLPEGADYCDIAYDLVERVARFLVEVKDKQKAQRTLSPLRFEPASMDTQDWIR